jgi:phosphoribosylamine---glycine ligase
MNVLLIGAGGREHALAWKISQSRLLSKLFIAPGNAGTRELGVNVPIAVNDFAALAEFSLKEKIDMLVVGPEDPLVNGIHDYFLLHSGLKEIDVIGPEKAGARLEGSKDFAKEFMLRNNIPTARYKSFTVNTYKEGQLFLESIPSPYVLKADGLAAGKGVLILNSLEDAKTELKSMLEGKFGHASECVVIEEYLQGIELSAFVLTDGSSYKILPEAKDYKRIGEGDTGLNTGGMGAVSPVSFADKSFMLKVEEKIIRRTIEGLHKEGIPYLGFIFFGLINVKSEPYLIEYNVRLGDPESEVVLPRINSDILELFKATADRNLDSYNLSINPEAMVTIMLVSGGYPGEYQKGYEISGLDKIKNSIPFHAGTKWKDGKILTNGGRVIAISSFGEGMSLALQKSYRNADIIQFKNKYFRKDIGFDLIR